MLLHCSTSFSPHLVTDVSTAGLPCSRNVPLQQRRFANDFFSFSAKHFSFTLLRVDLKSNHAIQNLTRNHIGDGFFFLLLFLPLAFFFWVCLIGKQTVFAKSVSTVSCRTDEAGGRRQRASCPLREMSSVSCIYRFAWFFSPLCSTLICYFNAAAIISVGDGKLKRMTDHFMDFHHPTFFLLKSG